jgi:hypothetical protein
VENQPAAPISKPEPEPEPKPKPVTSSKCEDPTRIMRGGKDTGYVHCLDGAINRARALPCPDPINATACEGTEMRRSCETDAECTDKPHGFCMSGHGQAGTYCGCIYPCMSDAECGAGQACMCPILAHPEVFAAECAPAECRTNHDCPAGECGATYHFDGCRTQLSLQCRDTDDACRSSSDCADSMDCAALDSTSFQCTPRSCIIGRPLTVDGGVRVAGVAGQTWGATQFEDLLEGLGPEPARAAYWLEVAQMEHASVASFARFVQELLRFGAPPDLLTDALVAAADEVRHAEQTFAIASAYADEPLGPGALRVDDLSPTTDLELFATRLIVEGCVGETLGVAEALALLELDVDPLLRPRLERIAADETRHAALAWRTLKWIAGRVDSTILERAFEQACAQAMRVGEEQTDPAHGRLGTQAKQQARARALASVIEPCRRQLLRAA